jgi:hypothetical protein
VRGSCSFDFHEVRGSCSFDFHEVRGSCSFYYNSCLKCSNRFVAFTVLG